MYERCHCIRVHMYVFMSRLKSRSRLSHKTRALIAIGWHHCGPRPTPHPPLWRASRIQISTTYSYIDNKIRFIILANIKWNTYCIMQHTHTVMLFIPKAIRIPTGKMWKIMPAKQLCGINTKYIFSSALICEVHKAIGGHNRLLEWRAARANSGTCQRNDCYGFKMTVNNPTMSAINRIFPTNL